MKLWNWLFPSAGYFYFRGNYIPATPQSCLALLSEINDWEKKHKAEIEKYEKLLLVRRSDNETLINSLIEADRSHETAVELVSKLKSDLEISDRKLAEISEAYRDIIHSLLLAKNKIAEINSSVVAHLEDTYRTDLSDH